MPRYKRLQLHLYVILFYATAKMVLLISSRQIEETETVLAFSEQTGKLSLLAPVFVLSGIPEPRQ